MSSVAVVRLGWVSCLILDRSSVLSQKQGSGKNDFNCTAVGSDFARGELFAENRRNRIIEITSRSGLIDSACSPPKNAVRFDREKYYVHKIIQAVT
jgi:hypothetical protein